MRKINPEREYLISELDKLDPKRRDIVYYIMMNDQKLDLRTVQRTKINFYLEIVRLVESLEL
jgi:hypothetical protein